MIRRMGNMMKVVGQGVTQAARSNATSNVKAEDAAGAAFLRVGTIIETHGDGSYLASISSDSPEGYIYENCFSITDEPLEVNTVVFVSKTVDGTWVIHGSSK